MTDKAKILAEIERRKKFYYDRYIKKGVGCIEESRYDECVDLLDFINSLPEEPVSPCVECASISEGCKEICYGYNKWVRDNHKEEFVSKDLEEAIKVAADETKLTKAKNGHPFFSEENFNLGFSNGAQWQKANLWKPADGDDLPEIDREVIALLDNGKVVFAHRPPEYWDGKDIVTGKVTRNYPKTYDKGGWNIPDIVYWLDVNFPKEMEL